MSEASPSPSRALVKPLEPLNVWYVAAESRELKNKPLARTVANRELVLFRDQTGRAAALFDRCPHRNVQLSKGRVMNGRLQCPYHGWEFDSSGRCVHVPAQPELRQIPQGARTECIPIKEQQGLIWVWHGQRPPAPDEQPFYIPHFNAHGWGWGRLQCTILNSVKNSIENFIDCSHTGYIHGGLFRTPASHWAETEIATQPNGVSIEIEEESNTQSFLAKLLVQGEVEHQDRYIYPSTVQVAYRFGPRREIIGYQICTPVRELETRVFVHVNWHMGWLNPVVKAALPFVGQIILGQDLKILNNQGAMIRRYGEHFTSTEADSANLWIEATRKRIQRGQTPRPRQRRIRFKL